MPFVVRSVAGTTSDGSVTKRIGTGILKSRNIVAGIAAAPGSGPSNVRSYVFGSRSGRRSGSGLIKRNGSGVAKIVGEHISNPNKKRRCCNSEPALL